MIIEKGSPVVLSPKEFQQFYEDNCETSIIDFYDSAGYVVGSITAITQHDQFVLDVDIPADAILMSEPMGNVKVTREDSDSRVYEVKLSRITG